MVDTKLGQVTGRVFPEGVRAFLGIPYALPPVGKLRFEPPVPLASWGGVKLEALEFGAECIQVTSGNPSELSARSGGVLTDRCERVINQATRDVRVYV